MLSAICKKTKLDRNGALCYMKLLTVIHFAFEEWFELALSRSSEPVGLTQSRRAPVGGQVAPCRTATVVLGLTSAYLLVEGARAGRDTIAIHEIVKAAQHVTIGSLPTLVEDILKPLALALVRHALLPGFLLAEGKILQDCPSAPFMPLP